MLCLWRAGSIPVIGTTSSTAADVGENIVSTPQLSGTCSPATVFAEYAGSMTARNTLSVEDGLLVVVPRGFDKLWGFRRRIAVPLTHITAVSVELAPRGLLPGWRGPGLSAFGKRVGTFHPKGGRAYWNYSGSGDALHIELDASEHFRQFYLSVDDAEATRQLIAGAIRRHSTARNN
jgi:hypothetical protein